MFTQVLNAMDLGALYIYDPGVFAVGDMTDLH
jgi:hypothetical protein